MDLASYVVRAVVVEGRSVAEVAAAHGMARSWLYELVARYRANGEEGLAPRSKRPRGSPTKLSAALEEEIVVLRKALSDEGLDAGPHTIQFHVSRRRRRASVPSVATIWRILQRRGFVTPSLRNGLAAPISASKPNSPTNAGRPTPPTGPWPTAPTWRSSTSSTTTPG